MEYNTERNRLVLREYGRNVQKLAEYASTIEDDAHRNKVARYIIEMMGQMNPHLRNVEEFRHKLWDHLIIISDYKLQVDSPYPPPNKEDVFGKPEHIGYPKHNITYRHYGKNVEEMIRKARQVEDSQKKERFIEIIGSYMKMIYKNWSRENVTDDAIRLDIEKLSEGDLTLPENADLDALTKSLRKRKPGHKQSKGSGGKGGNKQRKSGKNQTN